MRGTEALRPMHPVAPGKMAKVGTIDERFQSYNIETVEVTGGRFWKPFAKTGERSLWKRSRRRPGQRRRGWIHRSMSTGHRSI